jgi:hypothetical protein
MGMNGLIRVGELLDELKRVEDGAPDSSPGSGSAEAAALASAELQGLPRERALEARGSRFCARGGGKALARSQWSKVSGRRTRREVWPLATCTGKLLSAYCL